jgi:hypothetical protein
MRVNADSGRVGLRVNAAPSSTPPALSCTSQAEREAQESFAFAPASKAVTAIRDIAAKISELPPRSWSACRNRRSTQDAASGLNGVQGKGGSLATLIGGPVRPGVTSNTCDIETVGGPAGRMFNGARQPSLRERHARC